MLLLAQEKKPPIYDLKIALINTIKETYSKRNIFLYLDKYVCMYTFVCILIIITYQKYLK